MIARGYCILYILTGVSPNAHNFCQFTSIKRPHARGGTRRPTDRPCSLAQRGIPRFSLPNLPPSSTRYGDLDRSVILLLLLLSLQGCCTSRRHSFALHLRVSIPPGSRAHGPLTSPPYFPLSLRQRSRSVYAFRPDRQKLVVRLRFFAS